ncbi:MAG: hypothetical protein AAB371_02085 [Patescibacteria group bacterium]
MAIVKEATIITSKQLCKIQRVLPQSWYKAAGLLKYKKINPVAEQRKIRQEWENRLKKLEKQHKLYQQKHK